MDIINKCLSKEEFKDYIFRYNFGSLPANKLVIHHTWKPTKESWNGKHTIEGLKKFYEKKRWRTGPHLFIAEDGIWLFTSMRKNGIHAGIGNWRSIGIEVVGNYDYQKWEGKTKDFTLFVIKALQDKLNISDDKIMFHRDYSKKSCPGHSITKEWLFKELRTYNTLPVFVPPTWAQESCKWVEDNKLITKIKGDIPEDYRIAEILHRFYIKFIRPTKNK